MSLARELKDLARAEAARFFGPFDGIESRIDAPAVDDDMERPVFGSFGIDGDDDALTAEFVGGVGDKLRIFDRGRIDGDLVGAGAQDISEIVDRTDTAADRQRHEDPAGRFPDDIDDRLPGLVGSRDIEENDLIRPLTVIHGRALDRIADFFDTDEIDPFDDAAVTDIETRNDPFGKH